MNKEQIKAMLEDLPDECRVFFNEAIKLTRVVGPGDVITTLYNALLFYAHQLPENSAGTLVLTKACTLLGPIGPQVNDLDKDVLLEADKEKHN